jgi:hypothetical protein
MVLRVSRVKLNGNKAPNAMPGRRTQQRVIAGTSRGPQIPTQPKCIYPSLSPSTTNIVLAVC